MEVIKKKEKRRKKLKRRKCSNKKLAVFVFFLANAFCHNVIASEIIISWSGQVEGVVEFKDTALPAGITVGDQIAGTLRFDQSTYDKSTSILGNLSFGNNFYYYSDLKQSIFIDEWNWVLDSGKVILSRYYDTNTKYFDVYTNSSSLADFGFIEFPNFVGNFELGFALKDDQQPLDIFDTYSLHMATLDLNEVTWGGGHISSREWDENRDIIDGYYISFEILEANISSVPIPGAFWLLCSGLAGLVGLGKTFKK